MSNQIKEDAGTVPVTTTDNAGAGLKTPQLPIKPNDILRRYKKMKEKSGSAVPTFQK